MTEPEMIECPDCLGEGYFETMIALSYDGNQAWRFDRRDRCNGTGKIEAEQEMEF